MVLPSSRCIMAGCAQGLVCRRGRHRACVMWSTATMSLAVVPQGVALTGMQHPAIELG